MREVTLTLDSNWSERGPLSCTVKSVRTVQCTIQSNQWPIKFIAFHFLNFIIENDDDDDDDHTQPNDLDHVDLTAKAMVSIVSSRTTWKCVECKHWHNGMGWMHYLFNGGGIITIELSSHHPPRNGNNPAPFDY